MEVINYITSKDNPNIFRNISESIVDNTLDEHRRGSSFYKQSIVQFDAEDKQYFDDVDNFEAFIGTWETNQYLYDSEYGTDWEEIFELVRVEQKTVLVETIEWVKVS